MTRCARSLSIVAVSVSFLSTPPQARAANPFAGNWIYRSFRNEPTAVGDVSTNPSRLVALLFAEAQWVIEDSADNTFKGQLRFGPNDVMDLKGTISKDMTTGLSHVHIVGQGRPNTSTAMLFYDYDGWLTYQWPNGVSQRTAIVGSVIRVKPHDGAAAGYVASFIAVKQN
jgi:hypothetical protein